MFKKLKDIIANGVEAIQDGLESLSGNTGLDDFADKTDKPDARRPDMAWVEYERTKHEAAQTQHKPDMKATSPSDDINFEGLPKLKTVPAKNEAVQQSGQPTVLQADNKTILQTSTIEASPLQDNTGSIIDAASLENNQPTIILESTINRAKPSVPSDMHELEIPLSDALINRMEKEAPKIERQIERSIAEKTDFRKSIDSAIEQKLTERENPVELKGKHGRVTATTDLSGKEIKQGFNFNIGKKLHGRSIERKISEAIDNSANAPAELANMPARAAEKAAEAAPLIEADIQAAIDLTALKAQDRQDVADAINDSVQDAINSSKEAAQDAVPQNTSMFTAKNAAIAAGVVATVAIGGMLIKNALDKRKETQQMADNAPLQSPSTLTPLDLALINERPAPIGRYTEMVQNQEASPELATGLV